MTDVLAVCSDCESKHPLGSRSLSTDSQSKTECPSCVSPCYTTECNGSSLSSDLGGRDATPQSSPSNSKDEDDIREILDSVDGVGVGTIESIEDTVGKLTAVQYTTADELVAIDNVGPTVAERIKDAL